MSKKKNKKKKNKRSKKNRDPKKIDGSLEQLYSSIRNWHAVDASARTAGSHKNKGDRRNRTRSSQKQKALTEQGF